MPVQPLKFGPRHIVIENGVERRRQWVYVLSMDKALEHQIARLDRYSDGSVKITWIEDIFGPIPGGAPISAVHPTEKTLLLSSPVSESDIRQAIRQVVLKGGPFVEGRVILPKMGLGRRRPETRVRQHARRERR